MRTHDITSRDRLGIRAADRPARDGSICLDGEHARSAPDAAAAQLSLVPPASWCRVVPALAHRAGHREWDPRSRPGARRIPSAESTSTSCGWATSLPRQTTAPDRWRPAAARDAVRRSLSAQRSACLLYVFPVNSWQAFRGGGHRQRSCLLPCSFGVSSQC